MLDTDVYRDSIYLLAVDRDICLSRTGRLLVWSIKVDSLFLDLSVPCFVWFRSCGGLKIVSMRFQTETVAIVLTPSILLLEAMQLVSQPKVNFSVSPTLLGYSACLVKRY